MFETWIKKKYLMTLVLVLLCFSCAAQNTSQIITLGQDLTAVQKDQVIKKMRLNPDKVKTGEIPVIVVSNQEERVYLAKYAPETLIGTKAISSSYVEKLSPGEGISVTASNVTWVTEQMYANTLATAGVKDAEVYVTAPFNVSGTAALTGIYKAFEKVSGLVLPEDRKKTGVHELVSTGELGEEIGQNTAADFVERSKERIIEKKVTTPGEMKGVIQEVAKEMKVSLTPQRQDNLAALFTEIQNLHLDVKSLQEQLKKEKAATPSPSTPTGQDWLSKLVSYFMQLWQKLFSAVGRLWPYITGLLHLFSADR